MPRNTSIAPTIESTTPTAGTAVFPSIVWRFVAASIDLAVLWFVTELLSAFYEEELISLGRGGRFIGALFFLAYIGGQNSTFTNGRTLGKRLCRLRTVNAKGEALTLERSIARAALLLLPLLTSSVFLFPAAWSLALATHVLLTLTTIGYGGSLVASYLFTRQSGQALHDRLVGSFVVGQNAILSKTLSPTKSYAWHRAAVGMWLVLCSAGASAQWWWWGGSQWQDVTELRSRIVALRGVQRAEVFIGNFYFRTPNGQKQQTRYLEVLAVFGYKVSDFSAERQRLVEALLSTDQVKQFDAIRITVAYEFDLLFARRRWQQSWVRTPSAWRESLLPERAVLPRRIALKLSHTA